MIFRTYSAFSPHAKGLRRHFDERFSNPGISTADRFVWDYWHIPNEYTFLRTPAFHYFPRPIYEKFHRHLVNWGRENMGCHDVSPTWLSCYVDGCRQHWHRDEPHGPLAFVLSLTKQQKFRGGRTIIQAEKDRHIIEPKFNRLIVFDPSYRHGVDEVKGVHDPREARLVLHGWFVNPRVFWQGRLNARQVRRVMDDQLPEVLEGLAAIKGYASWRLKISDSGEIAQASVLVSTLRSGSKLSEADLLKNLGARLRRLKFPRARRSVLTLPLVFSS